MKGIVRRKALQSASRSERNFAAEGEQGEICEGVLWGCEVHRSRHPFLHRPMCAFDPLSRFLMLPASKVHVGAGRELTTLLNICSSLPTSGTYSVQSSCLNQITLWNSMKFSDTLRSVRSLWSPLRLPTPAAEQLPNAAFLFASSGRTAPQPPAGRPRWPLGTACGQERPGAPPSFAEHRGLRRAPRSSTCTERARRAFRGR